MSKVLDIWAIQEQKEELSVALDNITSNDTILFENAIIELTIGEHEVEDKIFSTVIYSEESDVIIMIMQNSPATCEEAKEILDNKNISYHTVSFIKDKQNSTEQITTPEIWFARDPYVVNDACESLINKNIENKLYTFDTEVASYLKFQYLTSTDKKKKTFEGSAYLKEENTCSNACDIKEDNTMEKTMKIEGMMCPHCEARVKRTLEEMVQVAEAVVSHADGTAVVKLAEAVENDVLKKIIEDQGYKVLDIQ